MPHEAPTRSSASIRTRIGPSPFFLVGLLLANPLTWIWAVVAAFRFSAFARYGVWKLAGFADAQRDVIAWYAWLKAHNSGTWLMFAGCAIVAYTVIRYTTTSYSITSDGDLVVNTGLLGMGTPRGPFTAYENTVSHVMITDVDVSRNLLQFVFGTGTLVVTFAEPTPSGSNTTTICLPFLRNAREACDLLMSKAGVKRARFVV
jgi:hypothetical protein